MNPAFELASEQIRVYLDSIPPFWMDHVYKVVAALDLVLQRADALSEDATTLADMTKSDADDAGPEGAMSEHVWIRTCDYHQARRDLTALLTGEKFEAPTEG